MGWSDCQQLNCRRPGGPCAKLQAWRWRVSPKTKTPGSTTTGGRIGARIDGIFTGKIDPAKETEERRQAKEKKAGA